MKAIKTLITTACLLSLPLGALNCQSTMPEILDSGTLKEQYEYLNDRTRIYNDFRAIREDMFQKIRSNSLDSLAAVKNDVLQLENQIGESNEQIESLKAGLVESNQKLDQAIKNRDRISFFGIPMNKTLYHSIVWFVIAGLAFVSGVLFLSNKRLLTTTRRNKRELEETREEFEDHRKSARERYEQLVVKHHNEIRKLKGN